MKERTSTIKADSFTESSVRVPRFVKAAFTLLHGTSSHPQLSVSEPVSELAVIVCAVEEAVVGGKRRCMKSTCEGDDESVDVSAATKDSSHDALYASRVPTQSDFCAKIERSDLLL